MDLKELQLLQQQQQSRHPWENARIEVLLTMVARFMAKKTNISTTVVDIGCGDVFVAEQLAKHFPSLKFLSVDEAFDENLLVSLKANLTVSNVELYSSLENATELIEKPAAIVLLLDVLEHIADDQNFLSFLNSSPMITDQSLIFITVPAFQSLYCSHDTFLAHYRRYNAKQLRRVAQSAGLEILEQGYFFSLLLLPRLLQVLTENILKKPVKQQKGLAKWKGNSFESSLIKSVLVADFKISHFFKKIGISLPGLSCYCILQKNSTQT